MKLNEQSALLLLMLLLGADLVFVVLNIITVATPILDSDFFILQKDRAYPEIYQYIKLFWIILLFLYVLKSTRCFGYVSWILVFAYLLCDDAFEIHETLGKHIATSWVFTPPLSLSLKDVGELAVSATIAILLLATFAWAYSRGSPTFRKISRDMLLFIVLLAFCGVFLDMAHSALDRALTLGPAASLALEIAEDGGEMVVVSLILWYVFLLAVRNGKSDLFLYDLLFRPLARRR